MSTYILLKDWVCPGHELGLVIKAGEKFVETLYGKTYKHTDSGYFFYPSAVQNPDWFAKEEETVDVNWNYKGIEYRMTLPPMVLTHFYEGHFISKKYYTETDLRERERLAFEAGRKLSETKYSFIYIPHPLFYPTFEDYIKTIKPL